MNKWLEIKATKLLDGGYENRRRHSEPMILSNLDNLRLIALYLPS